MMKFQFLLIYSDFNENEKNPNGKCLIVTVDTFLTACHYYKFELVLSIAHNTHSGHVFSYNAYQVCIAACLRSYSTIVFLSPYLPPSP